jgi:hypothetical protein
MPMELPDFICSHVPMEIRKKRGIKKRVVFCKGRFMYPCILLRFKNTLGLMPLGAPPSGEHTHARTSSTTFRPKKTISIL